MQKKKKKQKSVGPRVNKALAAIKEETERTFAQSDGRVIQRALALALHEQASCEEHLAGLQASMIEVRAKKARVEAKIAGLQTVIGKR